MNFYDIDDIIQNEQTLKVRFQHTLLFCDRRISKKKKHDLPYFLTEFFIANDHCTFDEPLNTHEINELLADPSNVTFQKEHILRLLKNCSSMIAIDKLFVERMAHFLKYVNCDFIDESDLVKLDCLEKRIISKSRQTSQAFKDNY